MMCKQVITFDTSMLPQGGLKIILSLFLCTITEETVSKFCWGWGLGMFGCVWQFGRIYFGDICQELGEEINLKSSFLVPPSGAGACRSVATDYA